MRDERATQYWDAEAAVIGPYTEMLQLTGPCAGVFLVFAPGATWNEGGPPQPDYVEDAHANQFDRPWPQFDAERFAAHVSRTLDED